MRHRLHGLLGLAMVWCVVLAGCSSEAGKPCDCENATGGCSADSGPGSPGGDTGGDTGGEDGGDTEGGVGDGGEDRPDWSEFDEAPPSPSTTAEGTNLMLGRGINLGNMLEAPEEGQWGFYVEQVYFTAIKDAGFNSVRLPINWTTHAAETAPYAIMPAFNARTDEVLEWALDAELAVVLSMHHYWQMYDNNEFEGQHDRFLAVWRQVAERYADAPASVVFELLNEPQGAVTAERWNELLPQVLDVVRASNPYRTLMVSPTGIARSNALNTLEIPEGETNIIISVHTYAPESFTQSGLDFFPPLGDPEFPAGATWTGTASERQALEDELDLAVSFATAHDFPLNMGEFGSSYLADPESRVRWTRFMVDALESRGFSWSYWDFCAWFRVYDFDERHGWNTELLDALIH